MKNISWITSLEHFTLFFTGNLTLQILYSYNIHRQLVNWYLILIGFACSYVFTIMCKQTKTMHDEKQLKPKQIKEPNAMYDCSQYLSISQLCLAIHPVAMANCK